MEAFYISEPGKSHIAELQQPRPAVGDVLLQTRLIGLCGTDLSTFRGKNPLVSYPRIPGHEISATIVEVGDQVPAEWQPGLDVAVYPNTACGICASCKRGRTNACKFNETLGVQRDGAMRGYFTAPWQKLFRTDGLTLRELTLVEPLAVGFHAVARGRVSASDTVAVFGCGMIGLGALSGAAARGATTVAIDIDNAKLALARQVGAKHTINTRERPMHDALLELTGGLGPDVVIEAVGAPETYVSAVEEVAHTGRVVYIGWTKQPVQFETKFFVHKELDILGSRNSLDEFPVVMQMLRRHEFPVDATISITVPFEDTGRALRDWDQHPEAFTKILVEVNP